MGAQMHDFILEEVGQIVKGGVLLDGICRDVFPRYIGGCTLKSPTLPGERTGLLRPGSSTRR